MWGYIQIKTIKKLIFLKQPVGLQASVARV